jgi:lysophospholipase L1-like esterase
MHTVVFTVTAGPRALINYVAGSGDVSFPGPTVYSVSEIRKSAAVYASQGDSDANVAAFNQIIQSDALSFAQDGLNVVYVDTWSLLVPGISGTVNASGTSVTWESGSNFNALSNGSQIAIDCVPYTIGFVNSSDSLTLTTSAGTQTNVSFGAGGDLADGLHPNDGGHAKIAAAVAQSIASHRPDESRW